jgi:hypothetical protein
MVLDLASFTAEFGGEKKQASFATRDGVSRQVIADENWIEPTSGPGEL